MAIIDEIADVNGYFKNEELIEKVKTQITNTKKFIKENKIGQYFVVYIDFGEKLTQKNDLTPRNPNDKITIKEMFNCKGYNCGFNEFRYKHMAVILSSIHHKYLLSKRDKHHTLLVAPISSNAKRINYSVELNLDYQCKYFFLDNSRTFLNLSSVFSLI